MLRLILIIFTYCCISTGLMADEKKASYIVGTYEHPQVPMLTEIIKQSYQAIGMDVKFVKFHNERGLAMLKTGRIDANIARIKPQFADYDSILPVATVAKANFYLLCYKEVRCDKDILYDPSNVIGAFSHNSWNLQLLLGDQLKAQFTQLSDNAKYSELLNRGRLKYIIIVRGDSSLPGYINDNNYVHLGVMNAMHVVHKKHAKIVPKLTAAIEQTLEELGYDFK